MQNIKIIPRITVAICTYNRAALLPGAIESLLNQNLLRSYYEILIIDNGSTDETATIIQRYLTTPNGITVRSYLEPKLGLSHARNHAVQQATGEIIAFIDDDAIADQQWLSSLMDIYTEQTDAWAVGGIVLPKWEGKRPDWLTDDLLPQLSMLDLGNSVRPLKKDEELYGVNCSFRRCVFSQLGMFSPDLGRRGQSLLGSEETEIQNRIRQYGKKLIYTPNAKVYHRVIPDRMRQDYFLRLAYHKGRTRARLMRKNLSIKKNYIFLN